VKNIPIIGKFLALIVSFGVFVLLVSLYAGERIGAIDRSFEVLVNQDVAAADRLSEANKAFQNARAALGDLLMARSEKLNDAALLELKNAHDGFLSSMYAALKLLPSDAMLEKIRADGLTVLESSCQSTLAAAKASTTDAEIISSQALFLGECQAKFSPVIHEIDDYSTHLSQTLAARSQTITEQSQQTIFNNITIMTIGLIFILATGFIAIRAWLVQPIRVLCGTMSALAGGDLSAVIEGGDRKDEIGSMARAVEVFKTNGLRAETTEAEALAARTRSENERQARFETERQRAAAMAEATEALAVGLRQLANGNLTSSLNQAFAPEFESLRADFNTTATRLNGAILSVAQSATAIETGSREISSSAEDLSRRTEQQAASLEQTAAALDQITASIAVSSKRVDEARSVAREADESALQSADVVLAATSAMQRIEQSSAQISSIISVIDDIAFQTNLLALNAGVEAARAGEAGKGFAVVAQEVRELAQRSASAAKEIKDLIRASSQDVENGVRLVSIAGQSLSSIQAFVAAINRHMEGIATSAREQSMGLKEINSAINQMDQVTQQNAAMVEENNAASRLLDEEARYLSTLVGRFTLGVDNRSVPRASMRTAA